MIRFSTSLRSAGRFSILSKSPPPQADVVAFRLLHWTGRRIRFEASPALSLLRPADLPFFVSAFSISHLAPLPPKNTPQAHPNAGNETPGPQIENAGRARLVRGRERGRKCQHHAQAGADVRHSQAACDPGNRYYRRGRRRGSLRRLRLSALARRQLPARPRPPLRFT